MHIFLVYFGPCLTTATWCCRKYFGQWKRSFLWKLRPHWLKDIRQRQIAVVRQCNELNCWHYSDVIMTTMVFQFTSLTVVYSIVYSDADQRKHQSSASLAFVWGIHRSPVNYPHKWLVTRKMFPFDDVIMGIWSGTFRRSDQTSTDPNDNYRLPKSIGSANDGSPWQE